MLSASRLYQSAMALMRNAQRARGDTGLVDDFVQHMDVVFPLMFVVVFLAVTDVEVDGLLTFLLVLGYCNRILYQNRNESLEPSPRHR